MTEKIRVEVDAEGTARAADGIDDVSGALGGLDAKQKAAKESAEALAQRQQAASLKAIEFTGKIAAAAGAVQGLTSALGIEGGTAGLIASTAGAAAAGAQLGTMFGPQGAVVGAFVGLTTSVLPALLSGLRDVSDETNELEAATRAAAESYTTLLARMREVQEQSSLERRLVAGLGSADEQGADTQRLQAQERLQRARVRDIESQLAAARAESNSNPLFTNTEEIADLTERLAEAQGLHATAANLAAEAAEREAQARTEIAAISQEDAETHTEAPARARGTGTPDTWLTSWEAALQEGERAAIEASERIFDALMLADPADPLADLINDLVLVKELRDEDNEAKLKGIALAEAEAEAQTAAARAAVEAAREQMEAGRANAEVQISQVQMIADGVGRAIAKIAETNATADEAAKILLATTLEVIGQTAQMLAGMEFAKAAAAYPDVAGMAIHALAGVAFTAVAIGTGEGAGALNREVAASQSARAQKPEPEKGGSGSKSGGDTIININSPIVTAGTHAELGRSLRNTIAGAERRGF